MIISSSISSRKLSMPFSCKYSTIFFGYISSIDSRIKSGFSISIILDVSIALFKDGRDWVRGPSYSQTETQGYNSLVELLSKMSKLWGLSTDQFYLMGSATYNQEKLRADIKASITHETRSKSTRKLGGPNNGNHH